AVHLGASAVPDPPATPAAPGRRRRPPPRPRRPPPAGPAASPAPRRRSGPRRRDAVEAPFPEPRTIPSGTSGKEVESDPETCRRTAGEHPERAAGTRPTPVPAADAAESGTAAGPRPAEASRPTGPVHRRLRQTCPW